MHIYVVIIGVMTDISDLFNKLLVYHVMVIRGDLVGMHEKDSRSGCISIVLFLAYDRTLALYLPLGLPVGYSVSNVLQYELKVDVDTVKSRQ